MTKKKIYIIIGLFLVVVLAQTIYAEYGCCINPLLIVLENEGTDIISEEQFYCSASIVSENACCGNPWYIGRPGGPISETECLDSYFLEGEKCFDRDECTLGYCCVNGSQELLTMQKCIGLGWKFSEAPIEECSMGGSGNGLSECGEDHEISLNVWPVKGKKEFSIQWVDTCYNSHNLYVLSRCIGTDCIDLPVDGAVYRDNDVSLRWDETYTYKLVASYFDNPEKTVSTSASMGNIECWGQEAEEVFCLYPKYYARYIDYFNVLGYSVDEQNLVGYISNNEKYGSKLNNAYKCDYRNILTKVLTCRDDYVCGINSVKGKAVCKEESECEPDFSDDPFGVFLKKEECTGLTDEYCYFDVSKTIVDKCMSCSRNMECYDYKSRDACTSDLCGIDSCRWKDIDDSIGQGVCVSLETDNCRLCGESNSFGVDDTTNHNNILGMCSAQMANKLSTSNYPCYFDSFNHRAISCNKLSCLDISDCEVSNPLLNADNSLTTPISFCNINSICQKSSYGNCVKNANGDDYPDCEPGDIMCERDYIPPETKVVPIKGADGPIEGFRLNVLDNISWGVQTVPTDVVTYICVSSTGCSLDEFSEIEAKELKVVGLKLHTVPNDKTFELRNGGNTLYYYSVDSSKNKEVVKSINFGAYIDTERPEIINVRVNNGYVDFEAKTIHTSSTKPLVELEFALGAKMSAKVAGKSALSVIPTSGYNLEYTVQSNEDYELGEYGLHIVAESENEQIVSDNWNLIVEEGASGVTFTPEDGTRVLQSMVEIQIEFERYVTISNVRVSSRDESFDIIENLSATEGSIFSTSMDLQDGRYEINVNAIDRSGNEITGKSNFEVSAEEGISLRLSQPRNGVSGDNVFDVIALSDNEADCRYYFGPQLGEDGYTFDGVMNRFDQSDGYRFVKENVELNTGEEAPLQIWCKDTSLEDSSINKFEYVLRLDLTPPVLQEPVVWPGTLIGDRPADIRITVSADDKVMCKYSRTQGKTYSSMEMSFENADENDFKNTKIAKLHVQTNGAYTYYIVCENEAGLYSEEKSVTFNVDDSIGLNIIDKTDPYQGTTTPLISLQTNKKAVCMYSMSDPDVITPEGYFESEDENYAHIKTLSSIEQGEHTMYARCVRTGEHDEIPITFSIDTTEPVIEYVDDTPDDPNYPKHSKYSDRIYIRFKATDPETGSKGFSYNISVVDEPGNTAMAWRDVFEGEFENIDGVMKGYLRTGRLQDNTKYIVRVRAQNKVGLRSVQKDSDGVITNFALNEQCHDNAKNSGETDVDCGGPCPACEIGDGCEIDLDCSSLYCEEETKSCREASCTDGIKNGGESDVDCGGPCDALCIVGSSCNSNNDCRSNLCENNICTLSSTCSNDRIDSGESDVDCGLTCGPTCLVDQSCTADSDCDPTYGLKCIEDICTSRYTDNDVLVTITPQPSGVDKIINTTPLQIEIDFFDKSARLLSVIVKDRYHEDNLTLLFNNGFAKVFEADIDDISDGEKVLSVVAEDAFGTRILSSIDFELNAVPSPNIFSIIPKYGVTAQRDFDAIFGSENDAICRYSPLDASRLTNITVDQFWELLELNKTGDTEHILSMYIEGDSISFTLFCKDEYYRENPFRYPFQFDVDATKPIITSLYYSPDPVSELSDNITLSVGSDDEVKCRYSQVESNFENMEKEFIDYSDDDFRNTKSVQLSFNQNGEYVFMVACENKAGLISNTRNITIIVDNTVELSINDKTNRFQSDSLTIKIETNKKSICDYSLSGYGQNSREFGQISSRLKETTLQDVNSFASSQHVYISCETLNGQSARTEIVITADNTAPHIENVQAGGKKYIDISPFVDRFYFKVFATDNQTGDEGIRYNYTLVTAGLLGKTIINWTILEDVDSDNTFDGYIFEDQKGEDLNLTDGEEYKVIIRAGNIVGMWSDEQESNPFVVNTSFVEDLLKDCNNNVLDEGESDVDCGGECDLCGLGKTCGGDSDCSSKYCNESDQCAEPSCEDGVQQALAGETDTDCGGDECDKCQNGDRCEQNSDCDSLNCKNEVCSSEESCENGRQDVDESDVDCGGSCEPCIIYQRCDTNVDCESGLECVDGVCQNGGAEDEDQDGDGMPDSWEGVYGLDPTDPTDGDTDSDNDGLTNLEEYFADTNPLDEDTDGDGFNDGDELNKYYTDPLDPTDKPKSGGGILTWIFVILLILILLGGGGYVVYTQYFAPKKKPSKFAGQKPISPRPVFGKPLMKKPVQTPLISKRREEKVKQRSSVFSSFDNGGFNKKKDVKNNMKKPLENVKERVLKKEVLEEPDKDVFDKLSQIIETKKKKSPEVSKLRGLNEQASKVETGTKKLGEKISKIEERVVKKPEEVVATRTGKKYHHPKCITLKSIKNKDKKTYSNKKIAEKKGLKSCNVCKPKKKK